MATSRCPTWTVPSPRHYPPPSARNWTEARSSERRSRPYGNGDLQGLGVTDYSISFGTPDSSLSLDAITVDTWSGFALVPEPSPVTLMLGGLTLLGISRLRRR
jgi:hypothetical protein